MFGRLCQPQQAVDLVTHIAEAARLAAVPVNGQIFATQRLFHEVGDDPAVIELHARSIGIKDACDTRVQFVIAVVGHGQGLREPFRLVVNRTRADGIHVTPIGFLLRMFQGIAIAFRGRSNQVLCLVHECRVQRMKGAQRADFQGGDSIHGVVHGTGGAGKVKHIIHLAAVKRLVDINLSEFEPGFVA